SRIRAETPVWRRTRYAAPAQRKPHRSSQYPPSKYASERAFSALVCRARYARVAASGSIEPDAPLAAGGGGPSRAGLGGGVSPRAASGTAARKAAISAAAQRFMNLPRVPSAGRSG